MLSVFDFVVNLHKFYKRPGMKFLNMSLKALLISK